MDFAAAPHEELHSALLHTILDELGDDLSLSLAHKSDEQKVVAATFM